MNVVRLVIVFIVVVVITLLSLLNSETRVALTVFNHTYENLRLVFLLLYSFLFGVIAVFLFCLASEIGLRRELKKRRKEKEMLQEELNTLRNLPLGPEPTPKEKK